MHNKSWWIDLIWQLNDCVKEKNRTEWGDLKKWGHDRSYESEHLYYIPCKERWAKLQYNKTLPSSTDIYSAAAYKPM